MQWCITTLTPFQNFEGFVEINPLMHGFCIFRPKPRGDIFPTLVAVSIEIAAAAATYGWDERENDNVA